MNLEIPTFEGKSELFDWLIANKSALIAQKKATDKCADAIRCSTVMVNDRGESLKSDAIPATATKIKVRAIINTTKIFDSHGDVHIDQLWNKSLKDNKNNYLVREHDFSFNGMISDNVKAFVKQMTWKDLGFDYEGNTQALIYDAVIDKEDNPAMFEAYRKGKVKQHSVRMRYIKNELAINDDKYEKEKAAWDKYYPVIANKADVDEAGYFWAVTEGKNIEGSAVVKGSNFATPTFSIQQTKEQPDASTDPEPSKDTRLLGELNKLKSEILN